MNLMTLFASESAVEKLISSLWSEARVTVMGMSIERTSVVPPIFNEINLLSS